jgi:GTP-binding protein HflX
MASCKNALIVSLYDDFTEICDLADSLDYKVVKTFVQHREKPDVNSYVGAGKLEEIKKFIEESQKNIDLVVVDGELKPSQWFTLEKKFCIDVFDRIRLILAIFEKRADRKEARLQVKLAQLQYERPFVRELIHRARSGEHPGFMAGGEYQVDDYYEMIKRQTKKIRDDLKSIRDEREVRRSHRHIGGFYLVSLAGYTNAGKSSLLNLLSGEKVKVEGRLFSTLSTTTRKIKNKSIPILVTDTVGFIQNLPALIIDAFHSTLEEISVADVVLLVVDISENQDIVLNKLKISFDELVEIGVTAPIIFVLNKCDLLSQKTLNSKVNLIRNQDFVNGKKVVSISAKDKCDIDLLLDLLYDSLPQLVNCKIGLPINKETQSFISFIYEKTHVIDVSYGDYVTVSFECSAMIRDRILSMCERFDGFIIN